MNFSQLATAGWYKDYNNWLPKLQWVCWIIVAFLLAKIFWVWVLYFTAPNEVKPFQVTARPMAKNESTTNISQLLNRNLFGSVQQKVEEPKNEVVVETKLNLKLRGIYAADTADKANAIIENGRGEQAVYFIDEKLNVSGRVFLREVFFDRVILDTNGKREALRIEQPEMPIVLSQDRGREEERGPSVDRGRDDSRLKKDDSRKKVNDKRDDKRLSEKLNEYREKLASDPKSIADVITGQPHVVNGELKGFRIQPGKDKRLFQELGLRRGDVVTAINGVGLTNIQDTMSLMNDARSMQEINVEIQRGNEQLSLLLNLNDKVGRR